MKMMSLSLLCAAAVLAAPVAAAQDAATPAPALEIKKNKAIVDANGRPLGKVYELDAAKGVVTFMSQMKIYRVPVSSLSTDGARIKTSLTKAQLGL